MNLNTSNSLATPMGFEPTFGSGESANPGSERLEQRADGMRTPDRSRSVRTPSPEPLGQPTRVNGHRWNPDGSPVLCYIEGCETPVAARGICRRHYMAAYRNRSDFVRSLTGITQCGVELCAAPGPYPRGYCKLHYRRLNELGDPLAFHERARPPRRELPEGMTPTQLGKLLGVSRQRASQLMEPMKHAARNAVKYALEQGIIGKPPFCFRCGNKTEDLEAHHWDYDGPLDVGWFCVPCHNVVHPHAPKRRLA